MALVLTAVREHLLALWRCYSRPAVEVAAAAVSHLQRIGGVRAAMTFPGINTLRGSSAADSGRVARPSAEPRLQPDQVLVRMQEWPLGSYLELRAMPMSVRSARLHARNILREWRMGALADTVELLVSEIDHQRGTRISQHRASAARDRAGIACATYKTLAHFGPAQRPDPGMGRRSSPSPTSGRGARRRGRAGTAAGRGPQHAVGLLCAGRAGREDRLGRVCSVRHSAAPPPGLYYASGR